MRITLVIRTFLAAAAAALTLGIAPAWAQTLTVQVDTSPDLGNIIPAATTSTNFSFASSTGTVTQSGSAVRKTVGTTRAKITIGCTGTGNQCANPIKIKIGSIGSPTGKTAAMSAFNATAISGSISASSGTNPLSFTITPANKNTDPSFYVGGTMPITATNSAGTVGAATSQFYVYAHPTNPTTGATVTTTANTYRPPSVSGTQLNFGRVGKPSTGTTTVTITPSTGTATRTVSGAGGPSTGWSQATFTITGENSLAITVSQDSSLTLSGPGANITASLTHTTFPTVIGTGGTTGSQGTSTFYTGGSFTIGTSQTVGTYNGSYNTTVSYN